MPIVLHEFSHYLSAGQPTEKKQRLTADFLQRCPAAAELPNPLNALEELLTVYWGQYRFEHDVRGGAFSPDDDCTCSRGPTASPRRSPSPFQPRIPRLGGSIADQAERRLDVITQAVGLGSKVAECGCDSGLMIRCQDSTP